MLLEDVNDDQVLFQLKKNVNALINKNFFGVQFFQIRHPDYIGCIPTSLDLYENPEHELIYDRKILYHKIPARFFTTTIFTPIKCWKLFKNLRSIVIDDIVLKRSQDFFSFPSSLKFMTALSIKKSSLSYEVLPASLRVYVDRCT